MITQKICVSGIVQGVGFRPFVATLARSLSLRGYVYNNPSGVVICIEGLREDLDRFSQALLTNHPPLASIDHCEREDIPSCDLPDPFEIIISDHHGDVALAIPADVALCDACREEMRDATNRRYRYPFINCTYCGPRYTIIQALPYDRPLTSMATFPMCPSCDAEYHDVTNRRYHAQPVACPSCGPTLALCDALGRLIVRDNEQALHGCIAALKEGKIVAMKGVGGFHLVCLATHHGAVELLRQRKRRPRKPLAVMVASLAMAQQYGDILDAEASYLQSIQAPIVVVRKKDSQTLSPMIAPDGDFIGLFLPYSPLHQLILDDLQAPLVATSANRSGEPLCLSKDEVVDQLADVVDLILDHDRPILNRCDDSVVRLCGDDPIFLRVGRGYAPLSLHIKKSDHPVVMGCGAGQKVTIAMAIQERIIVSPHIGDMGSVKAIAAYEQTRDDLCRLYATHPQTMVCDRHPHYPSTKIAHESSKSLIEVGHHYAHILALLLEHQKDEETILGVAWDGTGLGDDGTIWGGEFFVANAHGYQRVATFRPLSLLGGDKASREPRRSALSILFAIYGEKALTMEHPVLTFFQPHEIKVLWQSYTKNLAVVPTSSVGRLFDAVAAWYGIVGMSQYEGECGLILESLYDPSVTTTYPWDWDGFTIDYRPMFAMMSGDEKVVGVSKFFNTLTQMITTVAEHHPYRVGLSGGVFQNATLGGLIKTKLPHLLLHRRLSPNDGAISAGQSFFQVSNNS